MGTRFKQGFTIIETMLVLAVTGVLIATLLVGVGSSINAQRYKDSVSSLKDLLQNEYSMVDNVTNDHPVNQKQSCGAGAIASQNVSGVIQGQSDCVLMGRFISIVDDTISEGSVLGYQRSTTVEPNDILDLTNNYDLGISTDSIETSTLEWGAQIAWPISSGKSTTTGLDGTKSTDKPPGTAPSSGRTIGILIIRSPTSGTTYTFTTNSVTTNAGDKAFDPSSLNSTTLLGIISGTPSPPNVGQVQRFLCVDPSSGSAVGLTTVAEKLAVVINQAASSAGSIESRADTVTVNLGGTTVCQ